MAHVQFEEMKFDSNASYTPKYSFFVRVILGTGLVKTPQQAQAVLLLLSLIILFFSIKYLFSFTDTTENLVFQEDIDQRVRLTLSDDILQTYPSKQTQ